MTPALTDAELAELEAADRSATPGPWTAARPEQKGEEWPNGIIVAAVARGMGIYASGDSATFPSADRSLIVAARNALPALLAEVRDLRARIKVADEQFAERDKPLPCDVKLPPSLVVRKGCRVSTLLVAIGNREGQTDPSAATFDDGPSV